MASKTTSRKTRSTNNEGNKTQDDSLSDEHASGADKNIKSGKDTSTTPKGSEAGTTDNQETGAVEEHQRMNKPPHIGNKGNRESLDDTNPNEPKREADQKKLQHGWQAGFMNICVILLVLAFIALVAAILLAPPEPEMKTDFDFPKTFENKLMELQSLFINQTDRFWRIVKNRGLAHLRNADPPQPLVLLLAAPPAAHGVVDCLARKLAEVLDPRNKRTLATIDGTEEKHFAGEKAKKKMDELLINTFKAGHRAALIHHLELLPPPSPLLFYSYCDDQNAPHKRVAIIFTVHLPAEPDASLSPNEAEGTVEKYLSSEVWAREDRDAVAALLSRVADTVALMNGEPDSVKASC